MIFILVFCLLLTPLRNGTNKETHTHRQMDIATYKLNLFVSVLIFPKLFLNKKSRLFDFYRVFKMTYSNISNLFCLIFVLFLLPSTVLSRPQDAEEGGHPEPGPLSTLLGTSSCEGRAGKESFQGKFVSLSSSYSY